MFFLFFTSSNAPSNAEVLVVRPPAVNALLKMAVQEAHRRLGNPECRQIFNDFVDASGRSLQENLEILGKTGQSYLGWLWFVDGELQGLCANPASLAVTVPGSRVVYFCGDRFRHEILRQKLGLLATMIIHEELHSLGLGENPPESWEITRRVELRCGS